MDTGRIACYTCSLFGFHAVDPANACIFKPLCNILIKFMMSLFSSCNNVHMAETRDCSSSSYSNIIQYS